MADGTSSIDFDGMRTPLWWMHHLSLISLGFSYDPAYTDDSEVVVLEGGVGSGDRSIIDLVSQLVLLRTGTLLVLMVWIPVFR